MYTIIEATVNDVEIISHLAETIWWPTYSAILEKDQIRFMLDEIYSTRKLTEQIAANLQTYLLLKEGDRTVAFAAYAVRDEDPNVYKLHKLYCLPETQGKGYGKALIAEVCNRILSAGKKVLELNVNKNNNAKTFYEKMGFQVAFEEDIPIGPYWMNDYVMRKEL